MPNKVSSLILVKFKNQVVPKDYLQKVVDQFKSAHGGAIFNEASGQLELVQDGDPATVDIIQGWQEEFKDSTILMSFSNAEKSLMQGDLQPFIVLRDAKDMPIMVAAISGDFDSASDEASERTNLGLAVDDYIQPKLAKIFTEQGNNLDKVFEVMKNDTLLAKELMSTTKKGIITFLGANKEFKSFLKGPGINEGKITDKWGWCSLNLNLPVAAAPAPAPAPQPAPPPARTFGGKKTTVPTVASTEPVKPKETPVNPTSQPTETAVPPPKEQVQMLESGYTVRDGKLYFKCPDGPGYSSKNQVRTAYETKSGQKPEKYMQKPEVLVSDPKILKNFAHLSSLAEVLKAKENGSYPSETAGDVVEKEDEETVAEDTVEQPLITAEEKSKLADILLKSEKIMKAVGNKNLPNPEELQAMETTLPTFAEAAGLKELSETFWLDYADYKEIQKDCPVSIIKLLMDTKHALIQLMHKTAQKKAAEPETKPAATEPKKPARRFG